MNNELTQAIRHRRSYYRINNQSPVNDEKIKEVLTVAVKYVPSAFNSQSARLVLLLGKNHNRLWDIVKEVLRQNVDGETFKKSEQKINHSFASGYGTVLFFEDEKVVQGLQQQNPIYAERFSEWSEQSSAMHQFVVWTLLEELGLGASLQHYNPLIDEMVKKEWDINPDWKLISQMPFGMPAEEPQEKEIKPIEKRLLFFD